MVWAGNSEYWGEKRGFPCAAERAGVTRCWHLSPDSVAVSTTAQIIPLRPSPVAAVGPASLPQLKTCISFVKQRSGLRVCLFIFFLKKKAFKNGKCWGSNISVFHLFSQNLNHVFECQQSCCLFLSTVGLPDKVCLLRGFRTSLQPDLQCLG